MAWGRIMRVLAAIFLFILGAPAFAQPPIEAYGELPEIRALDFSPDGQRFAFFLRKEGREIMVVFENGKGNIGAIDVTDVKARGIDFISPNHVIVTASQTTKQFGGYEDVQSFTYNVATGELSGMAAKEKTFRFYPTTGGGSMTPTEDPDVVYYGMFVGEKGDYPNYSLIRGNLASGRASIEEKGTQKAELYVVTKEGVVIARQDYDDASRTYEIYTKKDGGWKRIYQEHNEVGRPMSVRGYTPDQSALIVSIDYLGAKNPTLHRLSFDGNLSGPVYGTDNKEPAATYTDAWGKVLGVRYAGIKPSYMFLDPVISGSMNFLTASFPQDAVTLVDFTDDMSKLVVSVSGGATSPAYFLYDRATSSLGKLTGMYLRIPDEAIAPVKTIEYSARDGLVIPSLLTHPHGAQAGARLPAIIMPHGGPEAYDALGFDDWAQYFASRGYVVLQPNFRGSDGFGTKHRTAGYGEWGGKMQDDVSDGVNYLVQSGWADPQRVCIVGASYGGYSALAGGAFTPDLYKCVVAVAPVTHVPSFLAERSRDFGKNSSVLNYWEKLLGDRKDDRAKMEQISPVNAAAAFKAPVLLMHGTDDTVVPYSQSTKMESALRSAGKDVTFVKLNKEDHWLSTSETRLQALQEMDKFIKKHLGPGGN